MQAGSLICAAVRNARALGRDQTLLCGEYTSTDLLTGGLVAACFQNRGPLHVECFASAEAISEYEK